MRTIAPPPKLSLSQWADAHRRLSSESSAEPGRWNTDRAPYQRGILDAVTDPEVENVVVMSSAQVGKTEILLNAIGFHINQDPAPILVVQPTLELAEAFSKDRLAPMVRDTPALRGKIKDARSRDANNTLLHKKFPGGHITLAGANSPASLASRPIRIVLCDEVDRYPLSAGAEGDPVSLAEKRTTTFFNKKKIKTSTPTIKGVSRIELAYEQSDQRKFHVPCPHCDHYQELKWGQVKWENNDPSTAKYECASCRELITDSKKMAMLKRGRWIAHAPFNGTAGFHLSELYSPWRKLSQIVSDFLEAKKSPEMLKTWVNTALGETWDQKDGDAPDWKRIYDRRELYPISKVPKGVLFLTAGVDVQKDRIEVEVVGWGKGKENWSIDYRVIMGDTSTIESPSWKGLEEVLNSTFQSEEGFQFPIRIMAVDSGYNTQTVYNWCRNYPPNRVMAVKGRETMPVLLGRPSPVDLNLRGRIIKRGFRVWPVGSDMGKSELYGWLRLEKPLDGEPFPSGFCHFPQYAEDYFEQLTAEHLVRKKNAKGHFVYVWEKLRERNEALDCRVYARAAASAFGLDRMSDEQLESLIANSRSIEAPKKVGTQPQTQNSQQSQQSSESKSRDPRPRRKSSFWGDR